MINIFDQNFYMYYRCSQSNHIISHFFVVFIINLSSLFCKNVLRGCQQSIFISLREKVHLEGGMNSLPFLFKKKRRKRVNEGRILQLYYNCNIKITRKNYFLCLCQFYIPLRQSVYYIFCFLESEKRLSEIQTFDLSGRNSGSSKLKMSCI